MNRGATTKGLNESYSRPSSSATRPRVSPTEMSLVNNSQSMLTRSLITFPRGMVLPVDKFSLLVSKMEWQGLLAEADLLDGCRDDAVGYPVVFGPRQFRQQPAQRIHRIRLAHPGLPFDALERHSPDLNF